MGGSASFLAGLAGFGFDLMIEGGRRNQQKKKEEERHTSFFSQATTCFADTPCPVWVDVTDEKTSLIRFEVGPS